MPRHYKRFWDESRGDANDDWGTSTWYFEVDDERYASRQIEVYENGNVLKYDAGLASDDYGGLSGPQFDEAEYAEFEISAQHFERVWSSTKAINRRRWLRSSLLVSGSPMSAVRRIGTLAFGALPATALLLLAAQIQYAQMARVVARGGAPALVERSPAVLLGIGWLVLGALGAIGLWRIAIQTRFVSRKNFYLLTAGLLAIWLEILRVLAMWLEPYPYWGPGEGWPVVLLILMSPVITAVSYLVAMVVLHRRGRDA